MAKFAAGFVVTDGKFDAGVVDTSDNFTTGVVDTGGKFATGVIDTGGAPRLANFVQKFGMTLVLFSGAWGKMIHEKNLKQNIS